MGDEWEPADTEAWAEKGGRAGNMIAPMKAGLACAGSAQVLQQLCKAMQSLELPGHRDMLQPGMLKHYLNSKPMPCEPPPARRKAKARLGVARWKGRALVAVARLVKRHGPALRQALRTDEAIEVIPTTDNKP
mmetsp:Transcript_26600/g.65819  ORF Transcript_26600/g.65819 Transcript_26600/m.65819 type:complete len:133 (-) Transcript_26600:175-573(-)